MKAISVRQPWAALTAIGVKTIELRSWRTSYRGPLLICATKKSADELGPQAFEALRRHGYAAIIGYNVRDTGYTVCVVELVDCRPMAKGDELLACRPYDPDLFSWVTDPRKLARTHEVPVKGRLSLFEINAPPLLEPYRTLSGDAGSCWPLS